MNKARLVLALIGLLGTIFAPVWVPIIAIALLSVRFRAWEALAIGLCLDFLWQPAAGSFPVPYFTILAIVIVWGLEPLRLEFLR